MHLNIHTASAFIKEHSSKTEKKGLIPNLLKKKTVIFVLANPPEKTRLCAASVSHSITVYMLVSHIVKMSQRYVKLMGIIKSRL